MSQLIIQSMFIGVMAVAIGFLLGCAIGTVMFNTGDGKDEPPKAPKSIL